MIYFLVFVVVPITVGILWAKFHTKKTYHPAVDPPEKIQAMDELNKEILKFVKEHPLDFKNYHISISVLNSEYGSGISVETSNYTTEAVLVEAGKSETAESKKDNSDTYSRDLSTSVEKEMWFEGFIAAVTAYVIITIGAMILGFI